MSEDTTANALYEMLKASQAGQPRDVDTTTLQYALYARKSTTSEDRQESSIPDQIKECFERLATPNNLNVVKIYQESVSAKIADARAQFSAMIDAIENGRIDGIIAWHPDRLARNMKEAGAIIDLVDRGLIKSLQFPTFTFENTPAGKMLLGITFVIAKQYSEHLAESVDRGNKRAVEDGEFIGKFKHGYIVDQNRRFEPDPRNFLKIRRMFEMALEGKSQKDIRLWINEQGYTVQKRPGGEYRPHTWDKDDVSKLIRDPHYAGVHKWGKSINILSASYDFQTAISPNDFLKINKVSDFGSAKILTLHSPRSNTKADLLRGLIYCGECNKTMTSMIIEKRYPGTAEIKEGRYYYKCETDECKLRGKSIRAGVVIKASQEFFATYLFTKKSNYDVYVDEARKVAALKSVEFTSNIARLKVEIAKKKEAYENIKTLILDTPDLMKHYDLDEHSRAIQDLTTNYEQNIKKRSGMKDSIPTFQEYLKLLQSTPDILGKIKDMKTMDSLLRIFFSNFTIKPTMEGTFKGSRVLAKLNEPWKGFVENDDFVRGAGTGTLTLDLFLGKEAL